MKEINAIKRLTDNFLKQHQIYTREQIKGQAKIGNILKNFSNEENKIPATITINKNQLNTNQSNNLPDTTVDSN